MEEPDPPWLWLWLSQVAVCVLKCYPPRVHPKRQDPLCTNRAAVLLSITAKKGERKPWGSMDVPPQGKCGLGLVGAA